jgi:hypothetical protein
VKSDHRATEENTVKKEFEQLTVLLLAAGLIAAPAFAGKKQRAGNPLDPYATADFETAPAVYPADLAYRAILFEDFTVPAKWENKARPGATVTLVRAINRLTSMGAFTTVAKQTGTPPEEPFLAVKCTLLDYRMVPEVTRLLSGAAVGSSHIAYKVEVYDGKTNALQFQREIYAENNPAAAAWTVRDLELPTFLGNVLGDYLALRARTDKGVQVLPLDEMLPQDVADVALSRKVEREAREWLGEQQTEPAEINVNGAWRDKSWGRVILNQREGSRGIVGKGDGWLILGVVSGKQVFLIFSAGGKVHYWARLSSDGSSSLSGKYDTGSFAAGPSGWLRAMHLTRSK